MRQWLLTPRWAKPLPSIRVEVQDPLVIDPGPHAKEEDRASDHGLSIHRVRGRGFWCTKRTMKKTDAEALYLGLEAKIVEVYKASLYEYPGVDMVILHVPGEPDFPLPIPMSDFRATIASMPDLLQRIDAGVEDGGFWFAIAEGDEDGTTIFLREVCPDNGPLN